MLLFGIGMTLGFSLDSTPCTLCALDVLSFSDLLQFLLVCLLYVCVVQRFALRRLMIWLPFCNRQCRSNICTVWRAAIEVNSNIATNR